MLEQRGHDLGWAVDGEGQPPALVRSRDVEHALVVAAEGALARQRAREGLAENGRERERVEEQRERLCALGVERDDPGAPSRIPAAAGERAQQLAQAVVVGEAEHRVAVVERGVEQVVHELWTIGRYGDGRGGANAMRQIDAQGPAGCA